MDFVAISLMIVLAAISPGPDFALVSRNALRYSRSTGIFTAAGVSLGILFHATYCILGFGLIISESILLFNIIKYIGAAYLIYIGVKGLLEKSDQTNTNTLNVVRSNKMFWLDAFLQGMLCNVLNPKAVFFFLAMFTMIINPSTPLSVQIGYSIEISLVHFVWFTFVSVLFAHHQFQKILGYSMHYVTKLFGGILVLFGLNIAMMDQK